MRILQWLLVIAVAVLLFPFLLRTVGLILAIVIGVAAIALIMGIGRRLNDHDDDVVDDIDRGEKRRATHNLRTEFAEDESFTEDELRDLRDRDDLD